MIRLRWFLLGVLFCIAAAAVAAMVVVGNANGFSAASNPSLFETWIARWTRSAAISVDARSQVNPTPDTPETLADARAHWADHCATCHANDGSGNTFMGRHTYPPAPDMRLETTQRMSDGELFYIIQNGVRLTAMPAWGGGSEHDAMDSWKLVRFIRHLPRLTEDEKRQMEKLNPKSPAELKEEEEEEKFLRGENPHEQMDQQHHH